jgi:hypothetical protein
MLVSNKYSARLRPALPMLLRSCGSTINSSSAAASNSTLLTGTRNPFTPFITTSLQPMVSVVTIDKPHAHASIKDLGKPSRYDGRHTISTFCKTSDNFFIGSISDCKVYSVGLTQIQVTSLMNNINIGLGSNITGYLGTPGNPDLFDVNITLADHFNYSNWDILYKNQPLYQTLMGNSNVAFSTFKNNQGKLGYRLLEIVAHKLFGHAQAHAAISNDSQFYTHDAELWDHLTDIISNNNFKNSIFCQYVALGRYNTWSDTSTNNVNYDNDVDTWVKFNFVNLTFDYPLYVSGNILLNKLTNSEINLLQNGPNVGGTLLSNGSYNIPILVKFRG